MVWHKFKAQRTEADGIKFASKREARRYEELKLLKQSGEVIFFLRQIPFDIGGGTKHFIDFMEFWADGSVKFVEVKGYDTPSGKMKRKIVEGLYPITIEVM